MCATGSILVCDNLRACLGCTLRGVGMKGQSPIAGYREHRKGEKPQEEEGLLQEMTANKKATC